MTRGGPWERERPLLGARASRPHGHLWACGPLRAGRPCSQGFVPQMVRAASLSVEEVGHAG